MSKVSFTVSAGIRPLWKEVTLEGLALLATHPKRVCMHSLGKGLEKGGVLGCHLDLRVATLGLLP